MAPPGEYDSALASSLEAWAADLMTAAKEAEARPAGGGGNGARRSDMVALKAAMAGDRALKAVARSGAERTAEVENSKLVPALCSAALAAWPPDGYLSTNGCLLDAPMQLAQAGGRARSARRLAFDVLAELSGYDTHLKAMHAAGLFSKASFKKMTKVFEHVFWDGIARQAWHGPDQHMPVAARALKLAADAARLPECKGALAGAVPALVGAVKPPTNGDAKSASARAFYFEMIALACGRMGPQLRPRAVRGPLPPGPPPPAGDSALFAPTSDDEDEEGEGAAGAAAAGAASNGGGPAGLGAGDGSVMGALLASRPAAEAAARWRIGERELHLAARFLRALEAVGGGGGVEEACYWDPAPGEGGRPRHAELTDALDPDTGLTMVQLRNEPYVQATRLVHAALAKGAFPGVGAASLSPVLVSLRPIEPFARGHIWTEAVNQISSAWTQHALALTPVTRTGVVADAERGEAARRAGNEAYKAGDERAAVRSYREAVCLNPSDVGALNNLSLVWLKMGRVNRATNAALEALSLEPTNAKSWFRLGACWAGHRRHQLAQLCFAMSLELGAHDPITQGRLDDSIAALRARPAWRMADLPDDVIDTTRWRAWLKLPPDPPRTLEGLLSEALPFRSDSKFIACRSLRRLAARARAEKAALAAPRALLALPGVPSEAWLLTAIDLGLHHRDLGADRYVAVVFDIATGNALAATCVLGMPRPPVLLATFHAACRADWGAGAPRRPGRAVVGARAEHWADVVAKALKEECGVPVVEYETPEEAEAWLGRDMFGDGPEGGPVFNPRQRCVEQVLALRHEGRNSKRPGSAS